MENTLADILSLIHTRETALQDELKKLDETKRLLTPQGGAQDTGRPANGRVNAADGGDAIPEVSGGWSVARRQRHSRMMKKRWAARKRAKQSKQ